MKVGIVREGKVPSDSRVPLTPTQCAQLRKANPEIELVVQPSEIRCYRDEEYNDQGVPLQKDLSDCDVLLGVKEVPIPELMGGKTYFFFSHTIKKQDYNRELMRTLIDRKIRMVDWETLTDDRGIRVIAFGRWAGIVGAHNGLWTWGRRTGAFNLPRACDAHDWASLKSLYTEIELPPIRIAVSGGGRVAHGAMEVLNALRVRKVSPEHFLEQTYSEPVYVQLDVDRLYARRDGGGFDMQEFFTQPGLYEGRFAPFTKATDLFINAIYWDPAAPVFFTLEQMQHPEFRIRVIADITCDIEGSIPSTLRATEIPYPIYGFNPATGSEVPPHGPGVIDHMTIDNLPNELPRDASQAFGELFIEYVWPELKWIDESAMIDRATIALGGELNEPFTYLQDYVDGR